MEEIAFTIHNKDMMLSHLISNLSILDDFDMLQELINKTPNIEMQIYLQSIMTNLKRYNFNTTEQIKLDILMSADPMQTQRKVNKPVSVFKLSFMNKTELRHLLYIRQPLNTDYEVMTRREINLLSVEQLKDYIKYMYGDKYQ